MRKRPPVPGVPVALLRLIIKNAIVILIDSFVQFNEIFCLYCFGVNPVQRLNARPKLDCSE